MIDYKNNTFTLTEKSRYRAFDCEIVVLKIRDKYSRGRHVYERFVFHNIAMGIEKYLRLNPHITFEHPHNIARRIIYLSKTFRGWSQYMPGGFATYPAHNPSLRRLHDGQKIDYLSRSLFKHAADGMGVRSRAYVLSWYVATQLQPIATKRIRWLSVASGTGQPTFDAAKNVSVPPLLFLTDRDDTVLKFAQELGRQRGISGDLNTVTSDVTRKGVFTRILRKVRPDVIDMMGFIEYIDDKTVVAILQEFWRAAPQSSLIFSSMRPVHPEINAHHHGLGWPGTKPRSVQTCLGLLKRAGIPLRMVHVFLPDDSVYAVYCINRA